MNLPSSDELERFVLGSALRNSAHLDTSRAVIEPEDFTTQRHRQIWRRICSLYDVGKPVDRVTVAEELRANGEAQSDTLGYLNDLDNGLPDLPRVDGYIDRLREMTLRRRMILLGQRFSLSAEDESQSLDQILAAAATSLVEISKGSASGNHPISTREMVDTEGLQSLLSPRGSHGIQLPWKRLSDALSGLEGGQLIVLMAATSRGKTSLALQVATCATAQGFTPVIWTMEMSPREVFRKMAVQLSGTYPKRLMTFEERSSLLDAGAKLAEDLIFFDSHSRTVGSFLSSLRQVRSQGKLGLGVVDYLQQIRGSGRNRAQEVSENSRALKLAAMDMQIPLLVLSQVDRGSVKGDGKIGLYSAKESGDIENDADVVLWIECPELSRDQDTMVSLHVGKQRDGPAGFSIPMVFRPTSQTFLEVSE